MIILVLAIYAALLLFDSWVVWMNVNDIVHHYMAGTDPTLWPFLWILLVTGGVGAMLGLGRSSK